MLSKYNFYRLNVIHQAGYSLLELSIIIIILGIMAAAVVPSFFSTDYAKLDAAAEIQAEAIRFARTEAMRSGEPIGFRQNSSTKRIRVFRVDKNTSPWGREYDIYHPVSRKLWDIKLENHPFAAVDSITNNRVFRGTCDSVANIYFTSQGMARCADPETVPLERYDVILTLGNETRTVSLNGFSGKVTIQ